MTSEDKIKQAQQSRNLEILKLEQQMRRAQAQPGSELLVENFRRRINKLQERNDRGEIYATPNWRGTDGAW